MPPVNHELIGSLAAILTTTSFVPQVVRTVRTRDTRAISLWMYVLFSSGVAMWCVYGILLESWPIIVANGVTFALAMMVLSMKVREIVARRQEQSPFPPFRAGGMTKRMSQNASSTPHPDCLPPGRGR